MITKEELKKEIEDDLLEIYIEKLKEDNAGNRVFDLDGNVLQDDEVLELVKVKK